MSSESVLHRCNPQRNDGGAPKERRRGRAETVVKKGVFGESVSSLLP